MLSLRLPAELSIQSLEPLPFTGRCTATKRKPPRWADSLSLPGPACVKTQKRPPEFDCEFEGLPGKAGSLLMRLLLAQGPPVISQAMFWARSLPLEA